MSQELLISVIGGILSSIASLVIGTLFGDKIAAYISKLMYSFSESQRGIEDVWLASFVMERGGRRFEYAEVIKIKRYFGIFIGNIQPKSRNYEALQKTQNLRPLRLRGEVKDSMYFTGYWYHPVDIARFHGAFQLVIHPDGITMSGKWIGYSETLNQIDTGEWRFERQNLANECIHEIAEVASTR